MITYEVFRNFDYEDEAQSQSGGSILFFSDVDFPWVLHAWESFR